MHFDGACVHASFESTVARGPSDHCRRIKTLLAGSDGIQVNPNLKQIHVVLNFKSAILTINTIEQYLHRILFILCTRWFNLLKS